MSKDREVLVKAITLLSEGINLQNGLAHPLDESRAKELLLALHGKGIQLERDDMYSLAIDNQWSEKHATSFADLAQKVSDGIQVRVSHPRDWGEPTLEKILEEFEK